MSTTGMAPHLRASETKPPVTEAHQRAAFTQMGWQGWTFEQAMADDVRSRVVQGRANSLRNREWRAALGLLGSNEPAPRTQHNFTVPRGTPRIF